MLSKMFSTAALAALLTGAMLANPAQAAPKKRVIHDADRPRTRVVVERRSFLDAGTVVAPGQRKFTDYAYPPGYSPTQVIDYTTGNPSRGPLPGPFQLPFWGP